MKRKKLYKIGVTSGDPFGIGPEVFFKSLQTVRVRNLKFVFYSDPLFVENILTRFNLKLPNTVDIKEVYRVRKIPSTHPSKAGGKYGFESIMGAVSDLKENKIQALITLPVSKKGIKLNGVKFEGHTEFLARIFGLKEDEVVMTFFSREIKVALFTTHLPLKNVHLFIKENLMKKKLKILVKWYEKLFNKTPEIAVLSFNPHRGENGGEERIIERVVRKYRFLKGPFSSDSFFAREFYKNFDIVFAIYHDQGLIPFKILSRGKGCNVTVGLPFLRVSPDHGPAYEIAGKGIASMDSVKFCIRFLSRVIEFYTKGGSFSRS